MAKSQNDPAQAIADHIVVLNKQLQPKLDEIKAIRERAEADVERVEASIADTREEIRRLELAAAALRGEASAPREGNPSGGRPKTSRKRVSDDVAEDAAKRLIERHEDGITGRQLAAELGISTPTANNKLNALIADGKLKTNGLERAQRRVLAP